MKIFKDRAFGVAPRPGGWGVSAPTLGCAVEARSTGLLSATHVAQSGYVMLGLGEGAR